MWRCFSQQEHHQAQARICSTHVEMFPYLKYLAEMDEDLLHACGDVSERRAAGAATQRSAPRMWRCFPKRPDRTPVSADLLHACGDVSIILISHEDMSKSAPRMWRCFLDLEAARLRKEICSTHVEMFPRASSGTPASCHLLHACGDVSIYIYRYSQTVQSAPRMWRCFW